MTHADSIWANALQAHADSLQCKVDSLQANLDAIQAKSDLMYSIIESSNSSVANQISSITLWVEVIAIIIAVGGGFLGYYISKKRREVERMAKTVDEKKEAVEGLANIVDEKAEIINNIAKTTEDLDKKIHNDLSGLYKQLHQEETKSLLERLVFEPLDIINIIKLLLAREVEENNFCLLREAFLKFLEILKNDGILGTKDEKDYAIGGYYYEPNFEYQMLFFQHYCEQSIKDDTIRPFMMAQLIDVIDSAFNRDIIKSTEGLCKALLDDAATFDKFDVLVGFLKALNNTKHNEYSDLKDILEKNVKHDLLEKAIEKCSEEKVYLKLFGIQPPKTEKLENGNSNNTPIIDGLHSSGYSA